ncbi:HD domain-containing protein [Halodesulfovibrio marinisediminis DSM 17456]|uniref:HD domain-containing protein n=2 Tax=Halodesulfovibrio marinisediminis TaxID=458711 RepID=A0A1N6FKI2_9BACT|nr:HD domain-containing protein [Halodesulfovibrio marinisediminis DSM 17456]
MRTTSKEKTYFIPTYYTLFFSYFHFIQRIMFFLILFCIIFSITASYAAHPKNPKKILVIHSYSSNDTWTINTGKAIKDTLKENSPSTLLKFEYMDSKNYTDPSYLSSLALMYANKYAWIRPDGIIVTDNNALCFIRTYGSEIFPDVPIIACGINNAHPPSINSNIRSIIAEQADHLGTIQQAIQMRPYLRTIHIVGDESSTCTSLVKEIKTIASKLPPHITLNFTPHMTLKELKSFASSRKKHEIIYLLPHFKTKDNTFYPQGTIERELAKTSSVPIIVSWSFQLKTGVVGGKVLSAYNLGRQAAFTLIRLLAGQPVIPLQLDANIHKSIYDYRRLVTYNINPDTLPVEATFINRPESFFALHYKAIIPATVIITTLSLILFLTYNNLQKQIILRQNKERIIVLDQEVIETQKVIVSTLGEVIEARSQETGGHVQRVAKISRFLGERIGMQKKDLDLLEAASPMHDVGKIGIPESILHKPGKLTVEEFEVIKTHTSIGKDILEGSNKDLLQIACEIAYQHHERWDGNGYPNGLRENDISIFARITMLADVYDALSSERCYKDAWPQEQVFQYIASERAKAFDPHLVDIFTQYEEDIRRIRDQYLNINEIPLIKL